MIAPRTIKEIKEICDDYKNGFSLVRLVKKYHIDFNHIKRLLIKNGIKLKTFLESRNRKHFCDKNFFKKVNNEEKAYWLGFLYADGCITNYGINLMLSQNDIEVLQNYKKSIKFTGDIELRNDMINYGGKYGIKESKMAKIRIHDKEMANDIKKLGCMSRKTFLLKFPTEKQVPRKYIRHFIRGYFDGDGSVWERKYKRKDGEKRGLAQITSTYSIVNNIKKIIVDKYKLNKKSLHLRPHPTSKGIFILTFASCLSMFCFRKFIYEKSNIYLKRKKNKFYELNLDFLSGTHGKSYGN